MDGETLRTTITGVLGFAGVVTVAIIASRTSLITASIALRQIESKEKADAAAKALADHNRDEEMEELKEELDLLRERVERKDSAIQWQKNHRSRNP